ncbi:hypothetical protein [Streptomyces sp. NPDC046985]|uniref:hypothetical protein n=1 Tax=Streptomyces sp. NPDC046985 TaxID=3155377 RepID=UPI0033FFDC1F
MTPKAKISERLRELARSIESMEEYSDSDDAWLSAHPETRQLIEKRGVSREQLNYSVPAALDLKTRINAYNAEHGAPGPGNVVAEVLDSWLRAQGYPPILDAAATAPRKH